MLVIYDSRGILYFSSRYDSRVINYERKVFIRLTSEAETFSKIYVELYFDA